MTSGYKVLILEDDSDLAESYQSVVSLVTGRRAVVASSFAELRLKEAELPGCAIAILDINLGPGQPSGVDAYLWLRAREFSGPVYFLTGHARSHPLVAQAVSMGGAAVLEKPVEVDRFIEVISGHDRVKASP